MSDIKAETKTENSVDDAVKVSLVPPPESLFLFSFSPPPPSLLPPLRARRTHAYDGGGGGVCCPRRFVQQLRAKLYIYVCVYILRGIPGRRASDTWCALGISRSGFFKAPPFVLRPPVYMCLSVCVRQRWRMLFFFPHIAPASRARVCARALYGPRILRGKFMSPFCAETSRPLIPCVSRDRRFPVKIFYIYVYVSNARAHPSGDAAATSNSSFSLSLCIINCIRCIIIMRGDSRLFCSVFELLFRSSKN